jgi:beta-lactamase regulating signal transducer with metallopeptidase domain
MDTLLDLGLGNALGAAVLALLVLPSRWLCRRPAVIHSLWLLVLLKLIAPPFLPIPLSWQAAAEPRPTPMPVEEREDVRLPVTMEPSPDVPRREEVPLTPSVPWSLSWRLVVGFVWATGALLWWGVAGWRIARFQRLLRHALPAPVPIQRQAAELAGRLGLRRCPEVTFVIGPVSPLLWAVCGRPRLLLPAELWERLSGDQRDAILVHELAHLRRRDHWLRRLELLVLGLYWWHPVVWWARRELREAEEQCCDAWVVAVLPTAAREYALALVETVTFLSPVRAALPLAASGIGQVQRLKRRVTMILRGKVSRSLSWVGVVAVLGMAVLLPLGLVWPQAHAAEDEPADRPTAVDEPAPRQDPLPHDAARFPLPEERGSRQALEQIQNVRDEIELLEAQRDIKRAMLQAAETDLKQAEVAAALVREMSRAGNVTEQAQRTAEAKIATAREQVRVKEAELKEAEIRLRQAQRRLAQLQHAAPTSEMAENLAWAERLFDTRQKDLGIVPAGLRVYRFGLTNHMKEAVHIANVRVSTALATPAVAQPTLAPGEVSAIDVTLDTSRLKGRKTVEIYVEFDKPKPALVTLTVSAGNAEGLGEGLTDPNARLKDLEKKIDSIQKEMDDIRKTLRQSRSKGMLPDRNAGNVLTINERNFSIPLQVDPARQNQIHRLILYVSSDNGETWQEHAIATPEAKAFTFHADRDGLYYLAVVTVDTNGKRSPDPVSRESATLAVRVDTTATPKKVGN